MYFPQFWARGKSRGFRVWRWSSTSLAEAQSLAKEAAKQLADRFPLDCHFPEHGSYYPDRPRREQILQEIRSDTGDITAVITRNSYGCQILNTAHVSISQKCFRARLTPKPWRCGLRAKPARWPWLDGKQKKRFEKWEARYQQCSKNWATCEFVRHVGNPTIHPEVQVILKLHDEPTRADSKLPLA